MTKPVTRKPPTAPRPRAALPVAQSPMDMLGAAMIRPDFNPATLEKLMDLADRWERDRTRRAYVSAKAAAKASIGVIQKTKQVKYDSKDKDKPKTAFDYAGLDDMYREVVPALAKHGLSHSYKSRQEGNRVIVTCVLSHEDGYSEDVAELGAGEDQSGGKNAIQAIASTVTYLQRMTLALSLGLAAGKDDDGKASSSPVAFITADQHAKISSLMAETGTETDDPRFLGYLDEKFAVKELMELNLKQADSIIAMLKRKRDAGR